MGRQKFFEYHEVQPQNSGEHQKLCSSSIIATAVKKFIEFDFERLLE
jgi:hypothetical protein